MSTAAAVLLALLAWLVVGMVASFVMGRRGHDPYSWGALGAAFGPFVVPLMIAATRRDRTVRPHPLRAAEPGKGTVDVLVGLDGSEPSRRALMDAVAVLGARLGRLTLATVLDYDAAEADRVSVYESEAHRLLESTARELGRSGTGTVILAGRVADALAAYAAAEGYELLVVGPRGRGLTEALLGSVASRLAHGATVPVLLGSTDSVPADDP